MRFGSRVAVVGVALACASACPPIAPADAGDAPRDAGSLDDADGGDVDAGPNADAGPGDVDAGPIPDSTVPIDDDTFPCDHPEYWPHRRASASHPLVVHYREAGHDPEARSTLDDLDAAWDAELALGFRAPLDDGSACGPDGSLDVFLWPDSDYAFVDTVVDEPSTTAADYATYVVFDPFGIFGFDAEVTLAHELNHAMQGGDDWWDMGFAYEATATFVEDHVVDDADVWQGQLYDFQTWPDQSVTYYDDYDTFYMYGAALFFFFLRDHYFAGDASFIGDVWLGMRDVDENANEPDFEDALSAVLAEGPAASYDDALIAFARWRYYAGSNDDGLHFEPGEIPEDADVWTESLDVTAATSFSPAPAPMTDGMIYVRLSGPPNGDVLVGLVDDDDDARFALEALPGLVSGTDGDPLLLDLGPKSIPLDENGERTIVIVALLDERADPDERDPDERHSFTLTVTPE